MTAKPTVRLFDLVRSPLLPVWAVIALLPFGRSAELGVALAIVGTLFLFIRVPRALDSHPGARLLLALWGCYTIAAMLSAFDAVNPGKSWGTVAATLRFAPLGLYVCFAVRQPEKLDALYAGSAVVVAFWLADAWLQLTTGWSLGGAAERERLSGMFGAGNLKLGPVLASLSPFLLEVARQHWGRRGLAAAFVVLLVPILLAGSRASWLVYTLVVAAFAWREAGQPLRFMAWSGSAALVALIAVGVAWRVSPAFDARVDRTLRMLEGSPVAMDDALAGRLRIWQTSARMIVAHPWNGVGVRDFRYAYPQHATSGDNFVQADGTGAAHAHQLVLEVLSETGVIGLTLWVVGVVLAWRAWRCAPVAARARAFAPAVALTATCFPFNTHLAFYSAWWGLLFWWLLGVWCAALSLALSGATDGA